MQSPTQPSTPHPRTSSTRNLPPAPAWVKVASGMSYARTSSCCCSSSTNRSSASCGRRAARQHGWVLSNIKQPWPSCFLHLSTAALTPSSKKRVSPRLHALAPPSTANGAVARQCCRPQAPFNDHGAAESAHLVCVASSVCDCVLEPLGSFANAVGLLEPRGHFVAAGRALPAALDLRRQSVLRAHPGPSASQVAAATGCRPTAVLLSGHSVNRCLRRWRTLGGFSPGTTTVSMGRCLGLGLGV
jgi:hypothetical protein